MPYVVLSRTLISSDGPEPLELELLPTVRFFWLYENAQWAWLGAANTSVRQMLKNKLTTRIFVHAHRISWAERRRLHRGDREALDRHYACTSNSDDETGDLPGCALAIAWRDRP